MKDRLENIPVEEWPMLRDLFKPNWPEHLIAYRTVQHCIDLKKKNLNYKIHIFSLNGKWKDGTFISFDGHHAQVYTLEVSCVRLARAVVALPKFNDVLICSTPERFVPAVCEALQKCNAEIQPVKSHMYWMPKEEAVKFDSSIREKIYIAKLMEKSASHINSLWPHKFVLPEEHCELGPHFGVQDGVAPTAPKTSEDWIRDMIQNSLSVGLYDSQHTLLSWVMLLHNDGLCALHTDPHHLRKGYASFVLKCMSASLALSGKDPFGFIIDGNTPSIKLFESLGFRKNANVTWIEVKPYESEEEVAELKRLFD